MFKILFVSLLLITVSILPANAQEKTNLTVPIGVANAYSVRNDGAAYLWIAYGQQTRQPDGSVTQRYHIRSDRDPWPSDGDCRNLKAFYRAETPSAPIPRGYRPATILCRQGDAYLDITSPTTARIDLFVVGTCGDRQLTGRTTQPLYGRASSDLSAPLLRTLDPPEGTVRLRQRPSRHTY